MNGLNTVQRLIEKERKACGGFVGAEIKDCETKKMCHSHRKQFIQK